MYTILQFPIDFEKNERLESSIVIWEKQLEEIFGKSKHHKSMALDYLTHIDHEGYSKLYHWAKFVNLYIDNNPIDNFEKEKVYQCRAFKNRFQNTGYLQIVFSDEVSCDSMLEKLRVYFPNEMKNVNSFSELYKVPFLKSFQVNHKDKEHMYNEVLYLTNPSFIEEASSDNQWVKMNLNLRKSLKLNDDFVNYYSRGIKPTYYLDNNLKEISNHFHSLFVIFHRSYAFNHTLETYKEHLTDIYNITSSINEVWYKHRPNILLSSKPKAFKENFFKSVQMSTLIDGEITFLESEIIKIKEAFDVQYKRVLANIEITSDIDELLSVLMTPYANFKLSIDAIKNLNEPTDAQIVKFNSLFEATTSNKTSRTLFALTVFTVIWGFITFYYSSVFETMDHGQWTFFTNLLPVVLMSILILGLVFIVILLINEIKNNGKGLHHTKHIDDDYINKLNESEEPIELTYAAYCDLINYILIAYINSRNNKKTCRKLNIDNLRFIIVTK